MDFRLKVVVLITAVPYLVAFMAGCVSGYMGYE
jgi:hypothetical protein